MATFDVTVTDVVAALPIDSRDVGANTVPLSTGDIAQYIEDADAEFTGIFGLSATSTTEPTSRGQANTAIKAYACARSLETMGYVGQTYRAYQDRYEAMRDQYRDRPQLMPGAPSQFSSNIDPDNERPEDPAEGRYFNRKFRW